MPVTILDLVLLAVMLISGLLAMVRGFMREILSIAAWGTAVSKDPYVKFAFKGGNKGDDLKISWTDNKGQSDTLTAKIA